MVGNNVGIRKAVTINAVIAAVIRKTVKTIFSGRKVNTNPEHARFAGINLIGYPINQAHRNCNCIRYFEILPIGNRYKGIIVKNVVTNDGITVAVCDADIPPQKAQILADADAKIAKLNKQFNRGFISDTERKAEFISIYCPVVQGKTYMTAVVFWNKTA